MHKEEPNKRNWRKLKTHTVLRLGTINLTSKYKFHDPVQRLC